MHTVPALRGLTIGDDAAGWRAAGFEVPDDRYAVGGVTVRLAGRDGFRGVRSWHLEHPRPADVEGLIHEEVDAAPPAAHRNGAIAVDHVVVGTSGLERTTSALASLGVVPRRTVEGVRDGRGARFRFFLLGTCILEVIAPTEPRSDRPARFWGVAFVVNDLEATVAALGDACGPAHDAVQPGRRIASLRHEDLGVSVPVAFMTARE